MQFQHAIYNKYSHSGTLTLNLYREERARGLLTYIVRYFRHFKLARVYALVHPLYYSRIGRFISTTKHPCGFTRSAVNPLRLPFHVGNCLRIFSSVKENRRYSAKWRGADLTTRGPLCPGWHSCAK